MGPAATLSITLRHGNTASAWNTKPMRGSIPVTGWFITCTRPTVGCSRPVIMFSVVDLPQPVGPTMATNSPRATAMVKLRSVTVAVPSPEMKRSDTSSNSIAGAALVVLWVVLIWRRVDRRCCMFWTGRCSWP